MAASGQTFLEDLARFSDGSLAWCAAQSADATQKVAGAVEYLVTDAARIANASPATRAALAAVREAASSSGAKAGEMAATMRRIAGEHQEVQDLVGPLVEALQFQDFLQQALQNMGRMISAWLAARAAGEDPEALGKRLLALTTTAAERDIVRRHIEGLPEEQAAVDIGLF